MNNYVRIFTVLLLTVWATSTIAQRSFKDSVNLKHDKITKTGLLALSAWSVSSIILGAQKATGTDRYFNRSNVLWGSVNLGIAQTGYWLLRRKAGKKYTAEKTFQRTETTEKLFLFNTGLDLAYVAYGLYNRERALRYTGDRRDRLRGSGKSLVVQGSFLTLFDGVLYLMHNKNGNRLNADGGKLYLSTGEEGVGLKYRL